MLNYTALRFTQTISFLFFSLISNAGGPKHEVKVLRCGAVLFTKIYLITKLNGAIHFIMATKRCVLITFKDESFVERLEILL